MVLVPGGLALAFRVLALASRLGPDIGFKDWHWRIDIDSCLGVA